MSVDFCAHDHPVKAVSCPDCRAKAGTWCIRPSGHKAADFHKSRKEAADAVFIAQYGEAAWIERLDGDQWRIHLTERTDEHDK